MRRNAAGWRRRLVSKLPICMRSWRSRSRSISAIANWLADGKALGLGQGRAILEDRGLAVPGQVGGRFAGAGRRIEIGGDAASRLRAAQQPARLGLADRDVARREIGENRGAGERGLGTRRHRESRCPRRSRHARRGSGRSSAANSRSVPNGAVWAPMVISPPTMPSPDDEMPRLVEFAIVGQMHLRHHAEQPAAMDGDRACCRAHRHGATGRRPAAAAADRRRPRRSSAIASSTASSKVDCCSRSLIA